MSFILLLLLLHNAFRQILILDKKSRKSATCLPNVFPLSAQCLPHFCLISTHCLPYVCPMSAKCLICLPNVPKFYLMSFSVKSLISSKMFFYIYFGFYTKLLCPHVPSGLVTPLRRTGYRKEPCLAFLNKVKSTKLFST